MRSAVVQGQRSSRDPWTFDSGCWLSRVQVCGSSDPSGSRLKADHGSEVLGLFSSLFI